MSGKVVTQMDRYKASSLEAFDTNHDAQSFLLTLSRELNSVLAKIGRA